MGAQTGLSAEAIKASIERQVATPRLTIASVAEDLFSSRSQVQRTMRAAGTSFERELKRARLLRAMALIIEQNALVKEAAARVGISSNQLRVLVIDAFGISPGQIRRAVILSRRLKKWASQPPPQDSYWYRKRWKQWRQTERELWQILNSIPNSSPLRVWSVHLKTTLRRPDYRRQPLRDRLKQTREREQKRRSWQIQQALVGQGWPTGDTLFGEDET